MLVAKVWSHWSLGGTGEVSEEMGEGGWEWERLVRRLGDGEGNGSGYFEHEGRWERGQRLAGSLGQVGDVLPHHLIRGIVDEDIKAAQRRHSLIHNSLAVLLRGEVRGVEDAPAAVLLDQALGFLRVVFFRGQVGDEAVGALHGEQHGDGAPDSRVAARDDRLLARELAGRFVRLEAAVFGGDVFVDGLGPFHLALESWGGLVGDRDLVAWEWLSVVVLWDSGRGGDMDLTRIASWVRCWSRWRI